MAGQELHPMMGGMHVQRGPMSVQVLEVPAVAADATGADIILHAEHATGSTILPINVDEAATIVANLQAAVDRVHLRKLGISGN